MHLQMLRCGLCIYEPYSYFKYQNSRHETFSNFKYKKIPMTEFVENI